MDKFLNRKIKKLLIKERKKGKEKIRKEKYKPQIYIKIKRKI